jgi:hypothetical protein
MSVPRGACLHVRSSGSAHLLWIDSGLDADLPDRLLAVEALLLAPAHAPRDRRDGLLLCQRGSMHSVASSRVSLATGCQKDPFATRWRLVGPADLRVVGFPPTPARARARADAAAPRRGGRVLLLAQSATRGRSAPSHGKQKSDLDTEAVRLVRFLQHPEMPNIRYLRLSPRGRRRPLASLGVR